MDDEVWEKGIVEISKHYLKTSFFIDFMACVPVLLYEAIHKFSTDFSTVSVMLESGWYQLWALFKVLRILQFDRMREILVRSAHLLDDIFMFKKVLILNSRIILWVSLKFILFTHFMVCVYVLVTNERIEDGASTKLLASEDPNYIF